MKMRELTKKLAVFLLSAGMVLTAAPLPAAAAEDPQAVTDVFSTEEDTETPVTATLEDATEEEQTTEEEAGPYDRLDLAGLFQDGKVSVTYPSYEETGVTGDVLTGEYVKAASGYVLTGSADAFTNARFTFTEKMNFDDGIVGRLGLDAMAYKATTVTLHFYLDDETESFADMTLYRQKRADKWYSKDLSTSVYDKKITGEHQISFTIEVSGKADTFGVDFRTITFAKSTVPMIYFDIDESIETVDAMNNDPDHDTECYGTMTVEVPDGYTCEYEGKGQTTETYEMEYIRGRGNSTWGTGKNPYKIKLDKKANLFNMGKNKHWVLLADYYDPTHMRNKMTYWMGQQLGMEFTPQCVYCDVVMNGVYYGSYLLCEQIRVGESRVDIDDLEADDATMAATDEETISGGYLLGMSPYGDDEDEVTFETTRGNSFELESPSLVGYENEAQYNYIKNYVQKTEDAIYSDDFRDADGVSYSEYMDVDAAVDYFWMQEFSMNGDGFGSPSTYLYKKRDGKLYWGPLWDFDFVAWGNNEYDYTNADSWTHTQTSWFGRLFADTTFTQAFINRWPAIREVMEEAIKEGGILDQYEAQIKDSMKYNAYLYGNNYEDTYNSISFDESVQQLKNWIQERITWVDANVNDVKASTYTLTFMDGSTEVAKKIVNDYDEVTLPVLENHDNLVFGGWSYTYDDGYTEQYAGIMYPFMDMTLTAIWYDKTKVPEVTGLYLGYEEKSFDLFRGVDLDEGDNVHQISYLVLGGLGQLENLNWTSSDENVAECLGQGSILVKDYGDAVITATTEDGRFSDSCTIHVTSSDEYIDCDDFTLDQSSLLLEAGESGVVTAIPNPGNAYYMDINWISMDDDLTLYTFDDACEISGKTPGTYTVLAIGDMGLGRIIRKVKVTITDSGLSDPDVIEPGTIVVRSGVKYEVQTMTKEGGTLSVNGFYKKEKSSVKIPSYVRIHGKKYKVTSIAKKAFYKKTKLTSVTIGKYVEKIGSYAFRGCSKLSKITILSSKLTAKRLGSKVFTSTPKKAVVKVPKAKKTLYKKLLRKAGLNKKATIR